MNDMTTAHKNKLMSDLQVVIADAQEVLRMTADEASERAVDVRRRVQTKLDQARADLLHLQDATVAKAKAMSHVTDEFVHEKPWRSIGLAAGIGLVVGMLAGRR